MGNFPKNSSSVGARWIAARGIAKKPYKEKDAVRERGRGRKNETYNR